jgi:hypothetical protein
MNQKMVDIIEDGVVSVEEAIGVTVGVWSDITYLCFLIEYFYELMF